MVKGMYLKYFSLLKIREVNLTERGIISYMWELPRSK